MRLQGVSTASERERDFFVLLKCNTQSYCIRERFVSLSCITFICLDINKSDIFLFVSSIVLNLLSSVRRIEAENL